MKQFTLISISLFFLVTSGVAAVADSSKEAVKDKIKTLDVRLSVEKNGLVYEHKKTEPYTGRVVEFWSSNPTIEYIDGMYQTVHHGQLKFERFYKDGLITKKIYYYENGQKRSVFNYKNGKGNGPAYGWYMNGQMKFKSVLKDDFAEGERISFYANGQIHNKINYKNKKREGPFVSYHENGKLNIKGQFKNDMYDGRCQEWDDTGKLIKDELYVNDKPVTK